MSDDEHPVSTDGGGAPNQRPDARLPAPDLRSVEAAIRRSIDQRRPDLLTLVGNGEFSIAIRWAEGDTAWVVKRVPPFTSRPLADHYTGVTREYLAALEQRDVRLVSTQLLTLDRDDGSAVVYHIQPHLDPTTLASEILRRSEPSPEHPVVLAVIDAIVRVVDDGVGFDGQFANWAWHDDEAWQLDFSTPLLLDDERRIRFDTGGFLLEYPAPVRGLVYREFMRIAPRYEDTTFVLTDLMTQLHREDLVSWCHPVATAARQRHAIIISPADAVKRFSEEAAFYPKLLRLKRLQRAWMQRTGRRYDTLLPATTGFGR